MKGPACDLDPCVSSWQGAAQSPPFIVKLRTGFLVSHALTDSITPRSQEIEQWETTDFNALNRRAEPILARFQRAAQQWLAIAIGTQGLAFETQSVGFVTQALAFETQSVGFVTQSVGFVTQSVGFVTQGVGFVTQGVGFVRQAVGSVLI